MKPTTLLTRLLVVAIGLSVSLDSCNTESANPFSDTVAMKSARGGVIHHVSAGGADANVNPDTTKPGFNANYSLVANVMGDGSVRGQYTDQFGHGDGGFHATIECVYIEGNRAWITAVGTSGTYGSINAKGLYIYTSVIDGGKEGDQISYSYARKVSVDCKKKPNTQMFDVLNGQVTVR